MLTWLPFNDPVSLFYISKGILLDSAVVTGQTTEPIVMLIGPPELELASSCTRPLACHFLVWTSQHSHQRNRKEHSQWKRRRKWSSKKPSKSEYWSIVHPLARAKRGQRKQDRCRSGIDIGQISHNFRLLCLMLFCLLDFCLCKWSCLLASVSVEVRKHISIEV